MQTFFCTWQISSPYEDKKCGLICVLHRTKNCLDLSEATIANSCYSEFHNGLCIKFIHQILNEICNNFLFVSDLRTRGVNDDGDVHSIIFQITDFIRQFELGV